jgi:hypothetical protein
MRLFMRHYAGVSDQPEPTRVEPADAPQPTTTWDQDTIEQRDAIQEVIKTICDEEALDR